MRTRSIIAVLLLLVAGLQTSWAQGFRVYKSDGTVAQFSMRTDSIVFYDGIGTDEDFGPFTPVNQCIVGTWYLTKSETLTFREDGTTDYMVGATYKFFPYQGNIIIYNENKVPVTYFRVLEVTSEKLIVSTHSGKLMVWSSTQPSQLVTSIRLSDTSVILLSGETRNITATVYPFDADNQNVIWESSDETVAQVINNGLVVAIGDGTCVITCRATDGSGVYAECKVIVGIDNIAITCAEAVDLTTALEPDTPSSKIYAVTGYITEVTDNSGISQQTFWMADTKNGDRVFEAYWAYLPKGVIEFKAGMKVTIIGRLMKFVNTAGNEFYEMMNPDVVILEDGGGDTPPVVGIDVTCAEAVELTKALPAGATSEETYTVTGYITEVVGNVSRNQQTFWMADTKDGGPVFEAYWANLPEGVTEFKAGMKVAITGHLMKYVNTAGDEFYEMKNADVVILENSDGGQGGDQPGPDDVLAELVNGGFESWIGDSIPTGWKSASTASNASLAKSYEARSGNFSCLVTKGNTVNRRLATQEIALEAGSYTFSFYAKSTTADVCQVRAGLVPVNADGSVGSYKYGDFVNINNSDWTLVTYDFVLTEKTTLCLIVMNPKDSSYSVSQDILVDDAALVKK